MSVMNVTSDRYSFLSKEEHELADYWIQGFRLRYEVIRKIHKLDLSSVLPATSMYLDDILTSEFKIPKYFVLRKSWEAYIGWAFLNKPWLVKYFVEVGKILKPAIDEFNTSFHKS